MAQSQKRIEQLAPELERIISLSEPIQDLADGFGGPQGPAEGPLWWRESGYLVFSDIHNNRAASPGRSSTAASPSSPTAFRAASSTGRTTSSSNLTAAYILPTRGRAPMRRSSGILPFPGSTG